MATITTNSLADTLAPPGNAPIARRFVNSTTDYFYALVHTATDTLSVYISTNSGGSWSLLTSFTHTGLQEWSSIVWESNFLHLAYRIGTGTADSIYYRRFNLTTSTWSSALLISNADPNGGTIGSRWQGVDLIVKKHSNGAYAILVCGAYSDTTPQYGMIAIGVSIDTSGKIYLNNTIVKGNRFWLISGTSPGRSGVSVEAEHNGDGFTTDTPNAWVTYGRNVLRVVKIAWISTSAGWQGPTGSVVVRSSLPTSQDYSAGRWDGTQWLMAVPSPDDATQVRVYQRNKANTSQASFDTPSHTNGNIKYFALSYNNTTKDIRVYAVGTSANTLYFVDYSRSLGTWSSWTQVSASTLANSGLEFGIRRGGTYGNAKHDVVYSISGSPNTVTHTPQSTSAAPATAQFVTTGQAYTNGSAANVGAGLPLAWTFSDIDPGGSQGSYALSRQIGAGTVNYWNATSSTWGTSEVQNTSSTQGVTLPTAWGVDGDSAHQYKVKVWDNTGIVSPGYSNPLTLYPSAAVNPTGVTPTNASVINSDTLTVAWTVTEQTGARIILTQTSPTGSVVYDSGPMIGYTSSSFVVPYALQNGFGYNVSLTTYNNDQLASTPVVRAITVSYAPPPPMYSTFTPTPASGWIAVAGAANTPVSPQPSIVSADLYRRPNITPTLNSNPTFAGNVTGWNAFAGNGGTLTYSTTQFAPISSPGAARLVPNGTGVSPAVESAQVTIDPTVIQFGSAWIRPDTANKPIFVQINWYTSGGAYISSVQVAIASPVAAAWHYLTVYADPATVPTAAKATVSAGVGSTPAGTDAIYADEVRLRAWDDTDPVRVASGIVPPATYNDWGPASGIEYEYQWVARGATGTTLAGPWLS
jgi:hypothetical protein